MMISPQEYVERLKDASYVDLIRERDKLISFMQKFEKDETAGDRSDPAWNIQPSPVVRYQVYFDYLAELCGVMQKKYNEKYVFGDRSLKQE